MMEKSGDAEAIAPVNTMNEKNLLMLMADAPL
jgi:hypothetical protein